MSIEVVDDNEFGILHLRDVEAAIIEALEHGEVGTTEAVNIILGQGAFHGASDIHISPWQDSMTVLYRIDGILHSIATTPKFYEPKVAAHIKVLADLIVYRKDIPQDGRINPEDTPSGQAMRVSTLPTVDGEKIVIRLMGSNIELYEIDALGFSDPIHEQLVALGSQTHGTVMLTGPAGSGKTTTIYAMLRYLSSHRKEHTHVLTIEDPVEYNLPNISQTQVNNTVDLTFENALRAILRQDPELIMVGEIRDPRTARLAIQAGLTGHMVISTIHSGTAAGVFTRLIDMGVEPFLVASSIGTVLAQRLIRVNCQACAERYKPSEALRAQFDAPANAKYYIGRGCDECEQIGYLGRLPIGESITMDDSLSELILERATTRAIQELVVKNGMRTVQEDGLNKVCQGLTSLEELRRVLPTAGIDHI